ncbi:MAG: ATPase, T2SS/T4P/T4SS family, partial [Shewanella sp.]
MPLYPHSGLATGLAAAALLSDADAKHYLAQAWSQQKAFSQYLVDNKLLDSQTLGKFCEHEYGVPLLDLSAFEVSEIPQKYLNAKLIEKHHALPIYVQGHTMYIAMSDPTNVSALEDFGFSFALHTEALLVEEDKLNALIHKLLENDFDALERGHYGGIDDSEIAKLEIDNDNRVDEPSATSSDDDAPIVVYINKLLVDAIKRGASDLHFEPYEHKFRVRFRIDGILHEVATPPVNLANRFAARL